MEVMNAQDSKAQVRRRAAIRSARRKNQLVEKIWFRSFLTMIVLLYIQDLWTDIFVGAELIQQNRPIWGSIIVGFVLGPASLLAISYWQKGEYKMCIFSIMLLSFFVRARQCWLVTNLTQEFRVAMHVKTLFGNMPMVIFQTYLLLGNHFVKKDCEKAFDLSCAAECEGLKVYWDPKEFTRFSCNGLGNTKNASTCWDWYAYCLDECVANEVLAEMQQAVDTFDTYGTLMKLQLLVKPGEMYKKKKDMDKAMRDFQAVMDEDSPAWVAKACWASASTQEPLVSGNFRQNEVRLGEVGRKIMAIKTLTFRVEYAYFQMLALVTHGVSTAATLTLRILMERYTEDEANTTIPDLARHYGKFGLAFFFHFVFDLAASAGSLTFFGVTECRKVKGGTAVFVCLVFIGYYSRVEQYKSKPRYKQAGLAVLHILLSPLSRAPGERDIAADHLRHVLILRTAMQFTLTTCGFYMLMADDPLGIYSPTFRLELFGSWAVIAAAFFTTRSIGIRAVWSDEWDGISHGRSIRVSTKAREVRDMADVFILWRIVRNPAYNASQRSTHVPLMSKAHSQEHHNILDFMDEDNTPNAGAEVHTLGLGRMGATAVLGAKAVGTAAHTVASQGAEALARAHSAGGVRSATAPKH